MDGPPAIPPVHCNAAHREGERYGVAFDPSWLVIRCLAAVALVEIVGAPVADQSRPFP